MKKIEWYFDPISPYAYLAFTQLKTLENVSVEFKPVLFGGLLVHWGQLGPAEIEPKREWTYRQIVWQARNIGVPLQMPPEHPFKPLPLLRLILAAGSTPAAIEAVFNWVWVQGNTPSDSPAFEALCASLGVSDEALNSLPVKLQLKANTDEAVSKQIFGVPTARVDGQNFWGFDALPMLREFLAGDAWYQSAAFLNAASPVYGIPKRK